VLKNNCSFREKPAFLLILITILYFYRPIFLGEVFYFRDLHSHFLPKRKLVAEYISRLDLPLWDPYLQGGKPLLANPNNMVLYPSNLLYLWIPAHRALTIEIILHLLMGTLGAYAFCRLLSFRQTSSFIAAVIYGFCGYTLSNVALLNWLVASAYLPVLFCFWHLYLTQNKKKWWLLSIAAASLQLLAGAPELTLITLMTLIGWSIWYPYQQSIRRRIASFGSLCLFTFGICAIQILPAVEFSRSSIRSIGFGFDSSTVWSLHPYRILEFIFPGILGRYDSIAPAYFWGEKLEGRLPFFLSVYVSLSALVLAFAGGFLRSEQTVIPRRLRVFLLATVLVSIILSTGRYLPGIAYLFEYFALRVPFRFPEKFLGASIFPISILAASGIEVFFCATRKRKTSFALWAISGSLLSLLFLILFSHGFVETLCKSIFEHPATPEMQRALLNSAIHSFFIWFAFCVLYQSKLNWRRYAFAAVLLLDLLIAGIPLKIFGSSELYTKTPAIAGIVQKEIRDGKLFRASDAPGYVLHAPSDDIFRNMQWQQEILSSYLAANFRIPVIFHDDLDASALIELNYLRLVIGSLSWEKKLPLLSAAGVTAVLTPEIISTKGLHPAAKIENASTVPLYLYTNENALAPIAFAGAWREAKHAAAALKMMTSPEYDPGKEVIVETMTGHSPGHCSGLKILENHQTMRSRVYNVEAACDGYLIFGEPNYPGWQLYVDGEKKQLVNANAIFSAVFVEKGRRSIKKTYMPGSVLLGTTFSCFSILVVLAIAFLSGRNERKRLTRTISSL